MDTLISEKYLTADDLRDIWPILSPKERVEGFRQMRKKEAQDFFLTLPAADKSVIITGNSPSERKRLIHSLAPDDAADVIQEVSEDKRNELLELLDSLTQSEVRALLAYKQDQAGGLMSPRFARIRAELTVEEAIRYLRLQAIDNLEGSYYLYVLGTDQRLLGVVSFRDLFKAPGSKRISEVMRTDVVVVSDQQDQEEVANLFAIHKFLALPVVDKDGILKGIITADDIIHAVQAEATEDIQKLGAIETFDKPYLEMTFLQMLKKRAGWLVVLFIGEVLTASVMAYYEAEIAKAVILALFVPLIISSGGNSGSQAATLVIRAMALGEVRLKDTWRIIRREIPTGLTLGLILGLLGYMRIILWEIFFQTYGAHYQLVALTVGLSLLGVVLWGTLTGSMLPFILRRLGFDPASASTPFVATLVDVAGIIIYFSVAAAVLKGTLL